MTLLTFITWLLSAMALLASIGAWLVTKHLWAQFQRSSSVKLSERLSEIEELVEKQSLAIRNLRSRLNMASYRERNQQIQAPETSATTDPEEEAARVRRELNAMLATKQNGRG